MRGDLRFCEKVKKNRRLRQPQADRHAPAEGCKERLYDGARAVGCEQNCYGHSIRSSSARNRFPLFGLIISTNETRPSSWARKSGFPSRFWLSGPRRAQLARVALRRSKSARITFGCVLTTMPAKCCRTP